MASVFDNVPELGGVEADARSVRHALALQHNLLGGATRYRREGSIITHNPNPIPNLTLTLALALTLTLTPALTVAGVLADGTTLETDLLVG